LDPVAWQHGLKHNLQVIGDPGHQGTSLIAIDPNFAKFLAGCIETFEQREGTIEDIARTRL